MKTVNIKSNFINITAAVLSLAGVAVSSVSCVIDSTRTPGPESGTTFTLELPAAQSVATRTVGSVAENSVTSLTLLLCDANVGKLVENGIITVDPDLLTVSGANNTRWTFKAPIPFGTAYDILFVANVDFSTLENEDQPVTNDTEGDIQGKLRRTKIDAWAIDGTSVDTSIPMFGKLTNKTFTGTSSPEPVRLRRMLARVNVTVRDTARSDFKLTGVYFYNYLTSGNLIPDGDPYDNDPSKTSIPNGAERTEGSLEYTSLSNDFECTNKIYVFESEGVVKCPETGWEDSPCIVVRGTYKGTPGYYRLDFVSGDKELKIVRNRSYNFSISNVSGPGYSSKELAVQSAPQNILVDVLDWNDYDLDDIDIDGTLYTVSTSPSNSEKGEVVANYKKAYGGMTIKLAAVPAPGYKFTGWTTSPVTSIDLTTDNPAKFTIGGDTSVTANFEFEIYPVSASVSSGGSVRISYIGKTVPITEAQPGAGVTFEAFPSDNTLKFLRWNIAGVPPYGFSATANPLNVQMPSWPLELTATFGTSSFDYHTFTIDKKWLQAMNVNALEDSYNEREGEQVSLSAPAANDGYAFVRWELENLALVQGSSLDNHDIEVVIPDHDDGKATPIYASIPGVNKTSLEFLENEYVAGRGQYVAISVRGGEMDTWTASINSDDYGKFGFAPKGSTTARSSFSSKGNAEILVWPLSSNYLNPTSITEEDIRGSLIITTAAGQKTVSLTQKAPVGGSDDILYFEGEGDNAVLRVGKWRTAQTDQANTNVANNVDGALSVNSPGFGESGTFSDTKYMAHFKFGGVVGVTIDGGSTGFTPADIKFNPTEYSYSSWVLGNSSGTVDSENMTYPNVPGYLSTSGSGSGWDGSKIVSSPEYHNVANLREGKGDPCQLVGLTAGQIRTALSQGEEAFATLLESRDPEDKKWRLPTLNENLKFFGNGTNGQASTDYSTWVAGSATTTSPGYRRFSAGTGVGGVLPASGYRNATSGVEYYLGANGNYWSSTPYSATNGYYLYFYSGYVNPANYYYYTLGFAVRCVLR